MIAWLSDPAQRRLVRILAIGAGGVGYQVAYAIWRHVAQGLAS